MNTQNVNRLGRTLQAEQALQQPERRKSSAVRSETKDQVTISTQAQEALKLREVISGIPEVRTDRVNALREAIGKGTYDVPAKAIAAKMLGLPGDK